MTEHDFDNVVQVCRRCGLTEREMVILDVPDVCTGKAWGPRQGLRLLEMGLSANVDWPSGRAGPDYDLTPPIIIQEEASDG